MAGGNREQAQVIADTAAGRRNKIRQAVLARTLRFGFLLAQKMHPVDDLLPLVIGKDHDIVMLGRVGRKKPVHRPGLQPLLADYTLEHVAGVIVEIGRRFTETRMIENLRETPVKLPGIEKRHPVDHIHQFGQRIIVQRLHPHLLRPDRRVLLPVGQQTFFAGLLKGQARRFPGLSLVPLAPCRAIGLGLCGKINPGLRRGKGSRHTDRTRRVLDVNHRSVIARIYPDRRMRRRGGRTANQQRRVHLQALHLRGHVDHFVQRRRNQT